MGSSHSAPRTNTTARKPLRWRGLVVVVLLFAGLWIFSDWLFLWSGHGSTAATDAVVVKAIGSEGGGKYRHVIRYEFPDELLDGVLPANTQARNAAFAAEGAASANGTPDRRPVTTQSRISVLLNKPLQAGAKVPVEYYRSKPWELHRVDGRLQVSFIKQYYLVCAVILIVVLIFSGFRTRRK